MSVNGSYGEPGQVPAAWAKITPLILPTVSLVFAGFLANALEPQGADANALPRPVIFYGALLWSAAYIVWLSFTILDAHFNARDSHWDEILDAAASPASLVKSTSALLLGVFFISQRKSDPPAG